MGLRHGRCGGHAVAAPTGEPASAINLLIMPPSHSCAEPFFSFCGFSFHGTRFLTGITTTARPTWATSSDPSVPRWQASLRPGDESFYFLADYHALIRCETWCASSSRAGDRAASWLAAGLDPEGDVLPPVGHPEIPELHLAADLRDRQGLLSPRPCLQDQRGQNHEAGRERRRRDRQGLFIPGADGRADILMFKAHKVPVGRDQVQHRDGARRAQASTTCTASTLCPEAVIDDHVARLPELDGRKMSRAATTPSRCFPAGNS